MGFYFDTSSYQTQNRVYVKSVRRAFDECRAHKRHLCRPPWGRGELHNSGPLKASLGRGPAGGPRALRKSIASDDGPRAPRPENDGRSNGGDPCAPNPTHAVITTARAPQNQRVQQCPVAARIDSGARGLFSLLRAPLLGRRNRRRYCARCFWGALSTDGARHLPSRLIARSSTCGHKEVPCGFSPKGVKADNAPKSHAVIEGSQRARTYVSVIDWV